MHRHLPLVALIALSALACSGDESHDGEETDSETHPLVDTETGDDSGDSGGGGEETQPDAACDDFCGTCNLWSIWMWPNQQACTSYCESQRALSETCDQAVGELNACVLALDCSDVQTFANDQSICSAEYQASSSRDASPEPRGLGRRLRYQGALRVGRASMAARISGGTSSRESRRSLQKK